MIHPLYKILTFVRRKMQYWLNMATVGVKAMIFNAQGEVLLVKHTYMSGWHLPGGGVEPGETPKMAIIREIREETGLAVQGEPHLFAIYTHQIMGASDYPMLYIVKDFMRIAAAKLSSEIAKAEWFHIQSLPIDTTESTQLRIKEYLEGLPPAERW